MMRRLQTHHNIGGLTLTLGVSFLFERYNLVSRALTTPFALLDWVPGLTGQHAWGVGFIVLGLLVLMPYSIKVRAIALVLGTMFWGLLAVGSLYEALFGASADRTGSYAGLLATSIVVAFLRGTAQIANDYRPAKHPLHHHEEHKPDS